MYHSSPFSLPRAPYKASPEVPYARSIGNTALPVKPVRTGDVTTRFGARIRELRRERNMTQMQMARRFGIDRSYISEVERGQKSVSLVILELIALGFQMSLSEIVEDI